MHSLNVQYLACSPQVTIHWKPYKLDISQAGSQSCHAMFIYSAASVWLNINSITLNKKHIYQAPLQSGRHTDIALCRDVMVPCI